tara:strand:+ start:4471 stop:6105 length:1635 start_codon:yes stop_codon:yes gene_type:complete
VKNYSSFLFFILLFFSVEGLLSSSDLQDNIDYNPSARTAIAKIVTGSTLCFLGNMGHDSLEYDDSIHSILLSLSSETSLTVGANLLFAGTYDILQWGYNEWKKGLFRKDNHKILTRKQKKSAEDLRPKRIKKRDNFYWNKGTNIVLSLSNTVFTGVAFLSHMENSYGMFLSGINILSPTVEELQIGSENITYCPLVDSGITFLSAWAFIHSTKELYSSLKQTDIRQGDTPLMGLFSGWGLIYTMSKILKYYPSFYQEVTLNYDGTIYKSEMVRNPLSYFLVDPFIFYGQNQIIKNFYQVAVNTLTIFKGRASVSSESFVQHEMGPQTSVQERPLEEKILPQEEEVIVSSMEYSFFQEEKKSVFQETPKRDKKKKRGTADPSKMQEYKKREFLKLETAEDSEATESLSDEGQGVSEKELQRHEALERVKDLGRYNSVKRKHIESLLKQACTFLSGNISSLQGSEYALVFHRGTQKISIKFEKPHGVQSTAYTGFKLKRVLSALETAYMYDWDEESVLSYMEQNSINKFYSIPRNLIYILWTRPSL